MGLFFYFLFRYDSEIDSMKDATNKRRNSGIASRIHVYGFQTSPPCKLVLIHVHKSAAVQFTCGDAVLISQRLQSVT